MDYYFINQTFTSCAESFHVAFHIKSKDGW